MVSNLIESLKHAKNEITSFELAENVVVLMDKIQGIEYANKINHYIKDYKDFVGKV